MSHLNSRSRSLVAVAAIVGALVVAGTAVLAAATSHNGGAVTKVYTLTSIDYASTSSVTPIDVAGMSTKVHVPSSQKALLVITFSSESLCVGPSTTNCVVSATVDGVPASPSGGVYFDSASHSEPESRSMQWIAGPIGPGDHTVKIQYNTGASTTFTLGYKTLTVLRSKV